MTGLFGKITDQMIVNCKDCITGKDSMDALWEKVCTTSICSSWNSSMSRPLWRQEISRVIDPWVRSCESSNRADPHTFPRSAFCAFNRIISKYVPSRQDPQELVRQLESCLKLNEAYQEQYRLTKTKLQQTPRGKQFDFSETEIFGETYLLWGNVERIVVFSRRRLRVEHYLAKADWCEGVERREARLSYTLQHHLHNWVDVLLHSILRLVLLSARTRQPRNPRWLRFVVVPGPFHCNITKYTVLNAILVKLSKRPTHPPLLFWIAP